MRLGRVVALLLPLTLVVSACTSDATPSTGPTPDPDAIRVVATTTVLADLVRQVGGTRVTVLSLVPKGGEVHTFDPNPEALTAVSGAQLIVMNGLGLDDWVGELAAQVANLEPRIVRLGENLAGVTYLGAAEGEAGVNPHLWLDITYARRYVERISEALVTLDAAHAAQIRASAAAYESRLAQLDAWTREQIATIPAANRKLVSFHDAFPYFARAYGLEIVGVAVEAPGQDPSAGQIAALIDAIRATGVRAVFTEAQFSPDLARTIADETKTKIVSNLYNDSVGDPPAETYEGLIRWDVAQIVEALR